MSASSPCRAAPASERTELARLLDEGTFVVSVQLDPPLGANPEALLATARAVRESNKAQFVDVNDNPRARARMSGIMASVAIERYTGVETIPHLTPRDMTVAGLESILLGSHAEGVRNILAVTGDPPESGDYPGTHGVYDFDSIGLVELMARLNRGEDFHGRAIDAPTSFFPGVAVNPTADDLELEVERFHRKVAAGARFAMTQLLFDLELLDAFRQRIGGTWPIPVLVGVWPIRTYETLVRMHNEMPGLVIPDHVLERYRVAGPAARDVGLALGHELIEGARAVAQGVYVMAPFKQPMNVVELLPELRSNRPRSRRSTPAPSRGRARAGRATPARRSRWARRPRLAKIVDSTEPVASTAGPPELPWRTRPATAVIVRGTGPCPYASRVRTTAVRPMRPGIAVSGPFSGIPEDRDGRARPRVGDPERRRRRGSAHAQHGDVVARVERDDVGAVQAAAARDLHRRVVLSRDDVRGGDDEPRRREPAASLDADTAGVAGDPDDGRLRAGDRGAADDRRARRRLCGRGRPRDGREGVDACEQPEQAARRHLLVEAADDRRALHFAAQPRLAGDEQCGRADHPDERDPGGRAEDEPAERVDEPERRQPEPAAEERADDAGDGLEEERAGDRAAEPGERRPGRAGAAVEQVRRRARADVGAGDEAAEREGARDEPAPEPAERGQRDERERDPVDGRERHARSLAARSTGARARGYNAPALGA